MSDTNFSGWAIVELMGHVRLAGFVTEEEHFGAKLGRIDIHNGNTVVTQFFGGGSVYRVTPTTEEIAREIAKHTAAPVSSWDLRAITQREEEHDESDLCADEDFEDEDCPL